MTKRTSGLAALAAVACLLGLAGCGSSDPSPTTLPPASSVPASPSATPSTTVKAQVEAAVRHYFDVANQALQTGKTAELKSLSTDNCPCRDLVRQIESAYGGGGHISGALFTVRSIRVHDTRANAAAAEIVADVAPYKNVDGNSKTVESSRGGELHTDFSFVKRGAEWLVVQSVDLNA